MTDSTGTTYLVEQRDPHCSGWRLYFRSVERDAALRAVSYLIRHVGSDRCRMRQVAPPAAAVPRLSADARLLLRQTITRGRMAPSTSAALFGNARDAVARRRASAAMLTLRRYDLVVDVGRVPGGVIPTAYGRRVLELLDDGDDDETPCDPL